MKQKKLFIEYLVQLSAMEVFGIASMLGIKLIDRDEESAMDIIGEIVNVYENSPRKVRRNIDKVMRAAVEGK